MYPIYFTNHPFVSKQTVKRYCCTGRTFSSLDIEAMEFVQIMQLTQILICLSGLLLHTIGILSIVFSTSRLNQTLIILNLSIAEMLAILRWISAVIYHYIKDPNKCERMKKMLPLTYPPYYQELMNGIFHFCTFQLLFTMYVLTIDRLICVTYPLFYKSRIKRSIVKKELAAYWFLSTIIGIILEY